MSSEGGGSPSDRHVFDPYDMGIIAITIITVGELIFLVLVVLIAYCLWKRKISPWLKRRRARRFQAKQQNHDAARRSSMNGTQCAEGGADCAYDRSPAARQSREDARRRRTQGSMGLRLSPGAARRLSALNPVPARIDRLPSLEVQDIKYHAGVETVTTPDGEEIEYCVV